MQLNHSKTRAAFLSPLLTGIIGITLLVPASYFMLTILFRILFGTRKLYYWIAPSFLQSPQNIFAFHKAQVIIGSLLLAILFNVFTILRFRLQRSEKGNLMVAVSYRRYWINTAIALQSSLLLITLIAYTLIQHIRY